MRHGKNQAIGGFMRLTDLPFGCFKHLVAEDAGNYLGFKRVGLTWRCRVIVP